MRPESYKILAEHQGTYWWHRARRKMAFELLHRYGLARGCRWLDLGCGPGGNLAMLDALSPALVAGVDVSPIALSIAQRNAPMAVLKQADVNDALPFPAATFDLVTIFNVLYHQWIKSEAAVLKEAARVLRPGGLLLLTEPAFAVLRRELDDAVMTRRRYLNADFNNLLGAAGFESLFASYFTSFGVPILLAAKLLKRIRRNDALWRAPEQQRMPAFVNEVFFGAASLEASLIARGISFPIGTTLVRVAHRAI